MPRPNLARAFAASLMIVGLPISAYAVVENSGATSTTAPSVIVFNQKPKAGEINVTYAFMPSAGHLVIYGSNSSGKPDKDIVGSVKLDAGSHNDVAVKLDKDLAAGSSLWASLTNAEKQSFWKTSLPLENEFITK